MKLAIFNTGRNERPPKKQKPDRHLPATSLQSDNQGNRLEFGSLREGILKRMLPVAAALGAIIVLVTSPFLYQSEAWPRIIVSALALTGLASAAVIRGLAYRVRLGIFLGVLFLVGVTALIADGLYGSGRIYLLALPLFAAIFTRARGRILWLAAAIGTVALASGAVLTGWIPAPMVAQEAGPVSGWAWASALANFIMLAVSGTLAIGILLQMFEKSLDRQHTLTSELETERSRLSMNIEAGSQDLERRLIQIRTAAEITRAISQVIDVDLLLPQVCELMCSRFNLYYVGVFLLEARHPGQGSGGFAVLKAGSGEAGQKMIAEGHRLAVGGASMIGWAIENQQPRIALDVGAEAVRFNNPHLPLTRSELALPILTSETSADVLDPDSRMGEVRPLGALTIQSTREAAFDQDDIVALQGIADGLAAAIENARLFAAMQAGMEEVQTLHRQYLQGAWQRAGIRKDLSYAFTTEDQTGASGVFHSVEVPLRVRGQAIGVLNLEPGPEVSEAGWNPQELALAQTIADQAALALENIRLLEESQTSAEAQRKAAGIAGRLWSSTNVETILRSTLQELSASLGARDGWIELRPPRQSALAPAQHNTATSDRGEANNAPA